MDSLLALLKSKAFIGTFCCYTPFTYGPTGRKTCSYLLTWPQNLLKSILARKQQRYLKLTDAFLIVKKKHKKNHSFDSLFRLKCTSSPMKITSTYPYKQATASLGHMHTTLRRAFCLSQGETLASCPIVLDPGECNAPHIESYTPLRSQPNHDLKPSVLRKREVGFCQTMATIIPQRRIKKIHLWM